MLNQLTPEHDALRDLMVQREYRDGRRRLESQ